MADHWMELGSGCIPVSDSFKMSLDDLRNIANKAPDTKGINRQLELCLVGLSSYFEAFCKDLFAFSLNVYPDLLERLMGWEGRDFSIDPLLAIRLGDNIRDKIGFIISERLDFGSAKEINLLYTRLLKVTPFTKDEIQHFSELLRDRNQLVHHGGMLTYRYLQQAKRGHDDAHVNSLVVDHAFYFRHHDFIESIARKMLKGAHRELKEFGKTRYNIDDNAPVESLLDWHVFGTDDLDASIEEDESSSPDEQDAGQPGESGNDPIPF